MTVQNAPSPCVASFDDVSIAELESLSPDELDALPFGVVGMAASGETEIYNATESRIAGLRPARVLGKPFFTEVAPCMNNNLVAHRFDNEPELDATINYVLTLRMKVTPARLRLLRSGSARRHYLLVQR